MSRIGCAAYKKKYLSAYLLQVWLSFAMFEKTTNEDEAVKNSRKIFQEAANAMKDANEKEERLMILESWQAFEVKQWLDFMSHL